MLFALLAFAVGATSFRYVHLCKHGVSTLFISVRGYFEEANLVTRYIQVLLRGVGLSASVIRCPAQCSAWRQKGGGWSTMMGDVSYWQASQRAFLFEAVALIRKSRSGLVVKSAVRYLFMRLLRGT